MRGLTFAAKTGEVHALLGHNGAGKSTAMNAIVSIVSPTAGDVIVFGESAVSFPDRARARIGLCPQFGAFFVGGGDPCWRSLRGVAMSHASRRHPSSPLAAAQTFCGAS